MAMAAPAPAELRRVGHAVADADPARLHAVVALLDSMADRGVADRLLDPVRPRLRRTKPVRPLVFARLLFMPLDPLIVPPPAWRRGEARVPRSAIAPIAAAVQRGLGAAAEAVVAGCAGMTSAAHAVVDRLGADLWPAAARVLPEAPPAGWAASGLAAADYPPLAALIRPLLANGQALHAAIAAAATGPSEALVIAALVPLFEAGPGPFMAGIAALLAEAVAPQVVAGVAASLDPKQRAGVLAALDVVLEAPPPELDSEDLELAIGTAIATCRRLDGLAACDLLTGPRAAKVQAMRVAADQACRKLAREASDRRLLEPLRALDAEASDAAVMGFETEARRLRHFTSVAARIGSGAEHDRILRTTAAAIAPLGASTASGLAAIDAARLVEILAGPEEAAKLLK